MARTKKKRSRSSGIRVSVTTVAGFIPLLYEAWGGVKVGNWEAVGDSLSMGMTGYSTVSGDWKSRRMLKGIVPIVLSQVARRILNALGVGRMLRKIPFITA